MMMLRMGRNIARGNGKVITKKVLNEAEKLLWGREL